MRPIAPRLGVGEELTVAEEQPEFSPMTVARVPITDGTVEVVGRWTLTPEERHRIATGEDIYISFPGVVYPHFIGLRPDYADPEKP